MNDELVRKQASLVGSWVIAAMAVLSVGFSAVLHHLGGSLATDLLVILFYTTGLLCFGNVWAMNKEGYVRNAWERVFGEFDEPALSEWDVENKWGEEV